MNSSFSGRLWLVDPNNYGSLLSHHHLDICYYRGAIPDVQLDTPIQMVDVTELLKNKTLVDLLGEVEKDLQTGRNACFTSDVPLSIDLIAGMMRRQFKEQLGVFTEKERPMPDLPEEIQTQLDTGLVLLDGISLSGKYYPSFSPSQTALIFDPCAAGNLEDFKKSLRHVYAENHPVFTQRKGDEGNQWQKQTIHDLNWQNTGLLLVPRRAVDSSLENFADVIAHLRAPNGCPWDRKQTHDSLRTYLLEETYEALADLDEKNMSGLKEELGDLVLQILLHAEIGVEKGEFNLSDVLEGINRKIIYRHPHVFGEVEVSGVKDVVQNWEKLKEKEREENGQEEIKGILDGVPPAFPALAQAQAIQDRAARVGFDWPEITPVKAKVMEELEEVYSAPDESHRAKELGDLLFAVVNLVRWYKVDAESALRETNLKFRRRFAYIEQKSRENGKPMLEMTLDQMDKFWEEAKKFDK